MDALRQLFIAELPKQRTAIVDALHSGDIHAAHGVLHQLKASCGFVGAPRLKAIVEALDSAPENPAILSSFIQAVKDNTSSPF